MAVQRKKSINDLLRQQKRIHELFSNSPRDKHDPVQFNRMVGVSKTMEKYIRNIYGSEAMRKYVRRTFPVGEWGDTSNVKFSRSTYMGLSKG